MSTPLTKAMADAQVHKELGNSYYRSGRILEASDQYQLACAADPTRPLLFFNLSASQFECGQYEAALTSTGTAIELCNPDSDRELLAKLWLRRAKCELHVKDFAKAREAGKKVREFNPGEAIKKDAMQLEKSAEVAEFYHGLMLEEEILGMVLETPKYRPRLCPEASEYYNLGHDAASSQFDPGTFPTSISTPTAFFFGGIGDARNFYATLISISQHRTQHPSTDTYHFTLNDIKPHTLARNFLVLLLINQLSLLPESTENSTRTDILTLLFYIYMSALFPPRVHTHFQRLLVTAQNVLITRKDDFPPWIWISDRDTKMMIEVYAAWDKEVFPASHAQACITGIGRSVERVKPKGCEMEWMAYRKTGALLPPVGIRQHEPKIDALLAGKAWEKKMKALVRETWKVNMTLVDKEWSARAGVWDVTFDPFDISVKFYEKTGIENPKNPTQLYEYFEPFFLETAKAFGILAKDIKVEFNIDDCMEILEEIRYSDKIQASDVNRPEEFPKAYDRIHLSNIPDYIGGHLPTFLYALPVLKTEPHAAITSNCLVNPPLWGSAEDFIAEYLCIPSLEGLKSATCLQLCPGQEEILREFLPLCEYINWQHSGTPQPLAYDQLLPRAQFTRWLLQLFFRLAVPPCRELQSIARIFSPLNLTAFIRTLVRLVEIGYPAHWASTIIEDILDDRITTTIRPFGYCPVRSAALEVDHPPKHISVRPFIPEMEALACTWLRILPFGIVSPRIPRPERIFEYRFVIEAPQFRNEFVNVLALVFYPDKLFEKLFVADTPLREVLSGEGAETTVKKRLRAKIIVVSVFEWDSEMREVTLRMKEGWIEEQKREERWLATLWRTDDWVPCSKPTSLRGRNLKKKPVVWIDPTIGMDNESNESDDGNGE